MGVIEERDRVPVEILDENDQDYDRLHGGTGTATVIKVDQLTAISHRSSSPTQRDTPPSYHYLNLFNTRPHH